MAAVSIIMPARNEELNVEATIRKLLDALTIDYEIVVVNDHSTDNTKKIVQYLASRYPAIRLIDNHEKGSFVNALLCGIKNITSPFFVPVMADLCDDPQTINKMYTKINDGYDIVVGSRYMRAGQRVGGSALKAFFSRTVGKTLHFLIGIPTHDVPNAFKMYRLSTLKCMRIQSQGFEVSVEIPVKAYFKGAKITEVPTVWYERKAGKSHFRLFKTGQGYIPLYLWAIGKGMLFRLCRFFR